MDTKNRLSSKNKNQRLSSKIKYDALDKLNEELGYAPVFKEGIKSTCGSHGDMQLSNEKNNRDEEFEHDSNGYSDKEIRERKKQLDLAQSRVEDLLQMVGNDNDSRQNAQLCDTEQVHSIRKFPAFPVGGGSLVAAIQGMKQAPTKVFRRLFGCCNPGYETSTN
ncbi:unnamed protein product [Prunus armeniaca]